jgi:hypothetical protein
VQILRQLPITRARMVRGIVANEARNGSTPFARSNSPRPMDPVDGPSKPTMLVRVQLGAPYPRRWERRRFPKSPTVSSSLTAGAAKLTGISIPG